MMFRRSVLLLPMLAAACGSSPPATLYALAPEPGGVLRGRKRSVELRRVSLAGYLDRPEIVRTGTQYRLELAANDRWGEPLGSMLGRVIVENLVQRLPEALVFTEAGAISTAPDMVVEIDVQRFDADAASTATLLAQLAIRHEGGRTAATARTIRLTAPTGPSTPELVATLSHLVGQFCDDTAKLITA
jgi:uncharacterized lipoprotein YmbA